MKKEVQRERDGEDAKRDNVAAFQVSVGRQKGHGDEQRFPYEGRADGYLRAAEAEAAVL